MTLPYTHLTLAERREIYRLRSAQIPVPVIAQRLGRHPSTIYREISRNWMHDDEPLDPRLHPCGCRHAGPR